nr:D-galactarate dehydratase [Yoonia ponticola]
MKLIYILPVLSLAACTDPAWQLAPSGSAAVNAAAGTSVVPAETLNPAPPPPPPAAARTVEDFDTTSAEDRAAAVAVAEPAGEQSLGTTNISLGPPAQPGIWLETGLVTELTQGRVENPANGKSVNLELRPSGGPATAGSQMSLAALRLLDVPLTALIDVKVYRK